MKFCSLQTFICCILLCYVKFNQINAKLDKYSKEANKKSIASKGLPTKYGEKLTHNQQNDKPFRTQKLNLFWQKARQKFDKDDPALKSLFKEFISQDKLEIDLKKKASDGRDEMGEYDAIVRQKLLDILETHGLADHAFNVETKPRIKDENETLDKKNLNKHLTGALKDQRLSKLWQKATTFGFSEGELKDLKSELMHQQRKVDEYNILKNEVADIDNIHMNSIERFKRTEDYETALSRKKLDLKAKFREMKDGFQYLEASAQKNSETSPDFNDPRVINLWLEIKNANFSQDEKDSFKEELKHFERKIEKHKYLKTEISASQDEKMNADSGRVKLLKENKLAQKIDEYDRKIKKTYGELKHRVAQAIKHAEL